MPNVIGTNGQSNSDGDQGQAGDFADGSAKLDSNVQLNLENLTKIDEKFQQLIEQLKNQIVKNISQLCSDWWELMDEDDYSIAKFEKAIFDVQRKSGLKNMVLERKLEALGDELEKKEAQLGEVLSASNLDPGTLALVSKKLDEVMDSKNQLIKALQYDVAKVSKAHNDLIRVYEAKLAEFGVPVDELGFRPLVTNTNTGPAGLVVGA